MSDQSFARKMSMLKGGIIEIEISHITIDNLTTFDQVIKKRIIRISRFLSGT